MSRPVLLVFLLIILIITSQFEWKQPLVVDLDTASSISHKQPETPKREEAVKEKIILSQEMNIHRLQELVRSLRVQLQQCRGGNERSNSTAQHPLTERLIELQRQKLAES